MWRAILGAVAVAFAGCAQIPPGADDAQAKTFSSVPDKSVTYIVRRAMGPPLGETISLDDETGRALVKDGQLLWAMSGFDYRKFRRESRRNF